MTRISTSAINSLLINRFLLTQDRLFDLQNQVSTEKKSQTYEGIAVDSQRLVDLENTRDSLQRFVGNNDQAKLRLDITETAVGGLKDAFRNFRDLLINFQNGDTTDQERVEQIQSDALRSLKDIETLLNTEADGRYVFGGARGRTSPVSFGLSTVSAYQSIYDGARVTTPTTRNAHIADFTIDKNSTNLSPEFLTFQQQGANGDSRINSAVAQFSNVAVGTTITLSGTVGGLNDGTFTVKAVDSSGLWVDVQTDQLTDETTPVTATFTYPDPNNRQQDLTLITDVTFDRQTNTITAQSANALTDIPAGSEITISGAANSGNNSTFTVKSNDGTDLVIESKRLVDDGGTGSTVHTVSGGNQLTFLNATGANGEDQIQATTTGTYSSLQVGQKIKVAGTSTLNDNQIFTVSAVSTDGRTVTLASTDNVNTATGTVSAGTVSTAPEFFNFNATEGTFQFSASAIDDINLQDTNPDTIVLTGGAFEDAAGTALTAGTQIVLGGTGGTGDGTVFTIQSVGGVGNNTATLIAGDDVSAIAGATPATTNIGTRAMTFTDNTTTGPDTIALTNGTFRDADGNNLAAGSVITISGTQSNNGTFTIASVSTDGKTATLASYNTLTNEVSTAGTISATATIGSISANSYFSGDKSSLTHRASDVRDFEFDLTGVDPAFEKAIRGIKLILQGAYGSEGGLDQHSERIDQSLFLMDDALDRTNNKPPPFGTEQDGSIEEVEISLGFKQVLVHDINQTSEQVIGFLDSSIADTENADPLEAITRLLDDQRVLEASYQTFARTRQLSLTNFI